MKTRTATPTGSNHYFGKRLMLTLGFTITLPWLNFVYAVEADSFDPAQTYQNTCFACHGTGAAHAPEVGD
ncbi:MAG: mono/diheme cytochrome c family protein, partial [Pseudohongiellaceae bacterium]